MNKNKFMLVVQIFGWALLGLLFATQSRANIGISHALAALCFIAVVLCVIIYRKENQP